MAASKHARTAQSTEDDRTMMSCTEKSLALKHQESEDPTLIHKTHDEANEVLKTNVLQIISERI